MRAVGLNLVVCALAASAPLVHRPASDSSAGSAAAKAAPFSWPDSFEGRPLTPLALGQRESRFAADFPGHIGRFTDGSREIILRHATRATRRMHPASDCLTAVGYRIHPLPSKASSDGSNWHCFGAARPGTELTVCEQLRDSAGRTWPDPSTWYWPALLGRSPGPWWSTTVVEVKQNDRGATR